MEAGLFSWGHAAFVLEKPKGRESKEGEQVKIHRNNSNAWAEKYLVAFHLHFPFWVRQSESNISHNSLAGKYVGNGGGCRDGRGITWPHIWAKLKTLPANLWPLIRSAQRGTCEYSD